MLNIIEHKLKDDVYFKLINFNDVNFKNNTSIINTFN